ncbi:gliding motility-associated C-terminal domain-containing protein [Hymenobacter metallicola]|uniref:Gliding motility-associated C-terminal domain-containing protein n=1 Tax=Hymenobacter metallicola TaxID=2563114 RepID=A0A4Z0QC18_9BACT|nr:gliding motility-associated C-terminal domain-containing protein [Hymenobacter metallicola]TGE27234.1 gliding motility-associated C-terminal domain-containing protein [Hymenobacter metallicola]
MQKLLQATFLLVVTWCASLAGISNARASHFQGGQLTYEALGNNRYKVSLTVFRDCGGQAFSTINPVLNYRTTGCTEGADAPMTLVGRPEAGSPYCASTPGGPSQCGSGLLTNYERGVFEATVTLPPAPEWTLSVIGVVRPATANIVGSPNLYYEARLNNLLPQGQSIQNTSAQYQVLDIPIPFVCYKQERTVTFSATEPDGDSLVYSLAAPLVGCNDPATYKSYSSNGVPAIDLTPPGGAPCLAYIQDNQGTYSPTYPISSYNISGTCPLKTAVKAFNFNASLGTFTFTPASYNTTVNSPENKYIVVGQVTEYRRLVNPITKQKQYYKVGQVRRDMLLVVIDCNTNSQPGPPIGSGFVKSGVQIVNSRDSTFVTAYTCNYTEVRFRFSDPNPNDILTVTHPELDPSIPTLQKPTYLPADVATFELLGNGTRAPAGILRIQPDIAFLGKTYRIPIKIEDNACPNKGIQYRTIVLKIEKGNFARVVTSTANPEICAGTSLKLSAAPFRPDSTSGVPARYGYRWEAAPGLPTSQLESQDVTVTPLVTTRYKVRILGLDFRAGTCSDTASVLVRVQQAIRTTAATTSPLICAGTTATITANSTRPGGSAQETFSYQWAPANGLSSADLTKPTITVKPTTTTRYKLTITGSQATACRLDTTSVLVRVQQRIQPKLSVDHNELCAGNTTTISASAVRPEGSAQETFSYQWAAAGGLSSGDMTKATLTVRPTVTTRYKLTVTGSLATACTPDTTSVLIRVQQPIQAAVKASQPFVCSGSTATLTATATRPGGSPQETLSYQWAAAEGLSSADLTKPTITVRPRVTTRFKLTVTGSQATACGTDTTSVLVRVTVPVTPAFKADSVAAAGRSITQPPLTFTFTNLSKENDRQASTSTRYRWSFQRLLNSKGQPVTEAENFFSTSPTTATQKLDVAGVYRIRLRAGVSIGTGTPCEEAVAELNVRVPDSEMPNVFTPNGDGINDAFVLSTEALNSNIQIFNRWGRQVFSATSYRNDWSGDAQPAGVYYYVLTDVNGSTRKGWVELVR